MGFVEIRVGMQLKLSVWVRLPYSKHRALCFVWDGCAGSLYSWLITDLRRVIKSNQVKRTFLITAVRVTTTWLFVYPVWVLTVRCHWLDANQVGCSKIRRSAGAVCTVPYGTWRCSMQPFVSALGVSTPLIHIPYLPCANDRWGCSNWWAGRTYPNWFKAGALRWVVSAPISFRCTIGTL